MTKTITVVTVALVAISGATVAEGATPAQAGEQVAVKGTFVRVAANDEGWVVVGYRVANESAGEKWMLLDVGITMTKDREKEFTKEWKAALKNERKKK